MTKENTDGVKTISNGKRGRNPLAPSEAAREAFRKLGIDGEDDVKDVIAAVAEVEDKYAEQIEENAQKERQKRNAEKALKSLTPEQLEELGFVTAE